MKKNISIATIIFFIAFLPQVANCAMDEDIQNSLDSVDSIRFGYGRYEQREAEAERLVEKYGVKLVDTMAIWAAEKQPVKRRLGLAVLAKLGDSEPVKKSFDRLIKNEDDLIRHDAVYALAKLEKNSARNITISALKTTIYPNVKKSIIPLLGIFGDPNTVPILRSIEQSNNEYEQIKKVASQAREYLEYLLNLPTKEDQESWTDQAIAYFVLPKVIDERRYRGIRGTYYKKAKYLAKKGHRFSLRFLRYHLKQKDPLAAAIVGVQREKDVVEELKNYLNEEFRLETGMFQSICEWAIEIIEEEDLSGLTTIL